MTKGTKSSRQNMRSKPITRSERRSKRKTQVSRRFREVKEMKIENREGKLCDCHQSIVQEKAKKWIVRALNNGKRADLFVRKCESYFEEPNKIILCCKPFKEYLNSFINKTLKPLQYCCICHEDALDLAIAQCCFNPYCQTCLKRSTDRCAMCRSELSLIYKDSQQQKFLKFTDALNPHMEFGREVNREWREDDWQRYQIEALRDYLQYAANQDTSDEQQERVESEESNSIDASLVQTDTSGSSHHSDPDFDIHEYDDEEEDS